MMLSIIDNHCIRGKARVELREVLLSPLIQTFVLTGQTGDLPSDCLPQRKYSAGAAPSITTAEVIGPVARDKTKSKFYSPVRCPNNEEKLEILHVMVKTGIQTVMSNHMYRWNNIVMLQTRGGGIGDKLAQAYDLVGFPVLVGT